MTDKIDFEMRFHHKREDMKKRLGSESMRILCLGNFSGEGDQDDSLATRRIYHIDVDNFDQILSKVSPHLTLELGDQKKEVIELGFTQLDDFHPDALFRRVDLFHNIRETNGNLVIQSGFVNADPQSHSTTKTSTDQETDSELLTRLLGKGSKQTVPSRKSGENAAGQLIESLVKPHIVQETNTSQKISENLENEIIGTLMRQILHHPKFQSLEAVWRSLHQLVTRLETGDGLELYLLDITKQELMADLQGAEAALFESEFYRLLTMQAQDTPIGNALWSCIACDFNFGPAKDEVSTLETLSHIAAKVGGPFLAGASHELLGCKTVLDLDNQPAWQPFETEGEMRWHTLRSSPDAAWLGLILPRILLRLPYGVDSDAIDSFKFAEIPSIPHHDDCLWGSGSYACAMLLGLAFQNRGPSMQPSDVMELNDLPGFVYSSDEGKQLMPCLEVVLSETIGEAILERGIMVFFGYRNRNVVRLAQFRSLALPVASVAGFWS